METSLYNCIEYVSTLVVILMLGMYYMYIKGGR